MSKLKTEEYIIKRLNKLREEVYPNMAIVKSATSPFAIKEYAKIRISQIEILIEELELVFAKLL